MTPCLPRFVARIRSSLSTTMAESNEQFVGATPADVERNHRLRELLVRLSTHHPDLYGFYMATLHPGYLRARRDASPDVLDGSTDLTSLATENTGVVARQIAFLDAHSATIEFILTVQGEQASSPRDGKGKRKERRPGACSGYRRLLLCSHPH